MPNNLSADSGLKLSIKRLCNLEKITGLNPAKVNMRYENNLGRVLIFKTKKADRLFSR